MPEVVLLSTIQKQEDQIEKLKRDIEAKQAHMDPTNIGTQIYSTINKRSSNLNYTQFHFELNAQAIDKLVVFSV